MTDTELVYLAIAYNGGGAGHTDFNHGHQDGDGVYYGQYINTFMDMSKHTPPWS
jgi:hypothetical protein